MGWQDDGQISPMILKHEIDYGVSMILATLGFLGAFLPFFAGFYWLVILFLMFGTFHLTMGIIATWLLIKARGNMEEGYHG